MSVAADNLPDFVMAFGAKDLRRGGHRHVPCAVEVEPLPGG
jgi:hypothetical protein